MLVLPVLRHKVATLGDVRPVIIINILSFSLLALLLFLSGNIFINKQLNR